MPLKDAVQINITCAVAAAEFRDRGGGVRYPMPGQMASDLGAIVVGQKVTVPHPDKALTIGDELSPSLSTCA